MKRDDRFFKHVRDFIMFYLPRHRCFSPHTVKAYREAIDLFRNSSRRKKPLRFPGSLSSRWTMS